MWSFDFFDSNCKSKSANLKGFTLVELMITVAIIGIVSSIAYASYSEQVKKSRLSDLKKDVSSVITKVEQDFFTNNRFPTTADVILPTSEYFTYTINTSPNSYLINGRGKAGNIMASTWAAANSQPLRCFCDNCPTTPTFNATTNVCPTNTKDW